MGEKLLPCICGGEAEIKKHNNLIFVQCAKCNAQLIVSNPNGLKKAETVWNRRKS